MSEEVPIVAPLPSETEKIIHIPLAASPAPPQAVAAEHAQAADALFAAREKESKDVAGLMAMWTGAMLLHDAALEKLRQPPEEEEPEGEKATGET
jgi:hypothetical protein